LSERTRGEKLRGCISWKSRGGEIRKPPKLNRGVCKKSSSERRIGIHMDLTALMARMALTVTVDLRHGVTMVPIRTDRHRGDPVVLLPMGIGDPHRVDIRTTALPTATDGGHSGELLSAAKMLHPISTRSSLWELREKLM
jgi:hypothetical protein